MDLSELPLKSFSVECCAADLVLVILRYLACAIIMDWLLQRQVMWCGSESANGTHSTAACCCIPSSVHGLPSDGCLLLIALLDAAPGMPCQTFQG